jgi:hypothetical protein
MPGLRQVALVPIACVLLLSSALPSAQSAQSVRRALPETVVIHDSRTSDPIVDIATVTLDASWYWDSVQTVRVTVPHGFQAGHRLTVYFDINGDSTPDGHYDLRLSAPKHAGGKSLGTAQEFRLGGGWDKAGKRVSCSDSEDSPPVFGAVRRGQRNLRIDMDLWFCLRTPNPAALDQASWRAAVRLGKGQNADMAPNGRTWSKPVAGWGPCDPSGGQCP